MPMDNEPIGERSSPFAVGLMALLAAGLAGLIYARRGTWPAEAGGLAVIVLVLLGIGLIVYAWQLDPNAAE